MKPILKYALLALTIILLQVNLFGQNKTIDSLKLLLKNAKHDTFRCEILFALSESEPDENIWPKYNEELMILAEKNLAKGIPHKTIYLKYLATAFNNEGVINDIRGNTQLALEYYLKSIKIFEELGDKNATAGALNNIGFIYNNQGDIEKALEWYHKSLKNYEALNDKKGVATSLLNIGSIYEDQNDQEKALEYFHKSLNALLPNGDKKIIAYALNNIGASYNKQHKISEALDFLQRSLKLREEISDKSGIATSLNNLSIAYSTIGNNQKALEYNNKSLKIREATGDKQGVAASLNNSARLLYKLGNSKQAVSFAQKSLLISNELGFPDNIKNAALCLKKIYMAQKKYKEAYEMYELEIKMSDSINNQETQKAAIKKQMQYTYEKKELEAKAEQDKKDTIAKAELKQKENERNYFIAGFGLVVALALFILRGYKQKQKANAIILVQKHLVDEKQKEILDSIHYAKRIQTALLPNEKYIKRKMNQLNKKA